MRLRAAACAGEGAGAGGWMEKPRAQSFAKGIFRRDRECHSGGYASRRSIASPLEARELNCRLVFDTIYRPRVTKLLQLAERRGIETVSGVEMFVAQGTAQWEIWTGERAPEAAMRAQCLAALEREESSEGKPLRLTGRFEATTPLLATDDSA